MLWYSNSKFSKFLINRDVTFNESTMLSPQKEKFDTENNFDVREKVKFNNIVWLGTKWGGKLNHLRGMLMMLLLLMHLV